MPDNDTHFRRRFIQGTAGLISGATLFSSSASALGSDSISDSGTEDATFGDEAVLLSVSMEGEANYDRNILTGRIDSTIDLDLDCRVWYTNQPDSVEIISEIGIEGSGTTWQVSLPPQFGVSEDNFDDGITISREYGDPPAGESILADDFGSGVSLPSSIDSFLNYINEVEANNVSYSLSGLEGDSGNGGTVEVRTTANIQYSNHTEGISVRISDDLTQFVMR